MYTIIEKKPMFGKLNSVDLNLKEIFETELHNKENFQFGALCENTDLSHSIYLCNIPIVQKDDNESQNYSDDNTDDNINNYNVSSEQIMQYFDFIFAKNQMRCRAYSRPGRTFEQARRIKSPKKIKRVLSWKKKHTSKSVAKGFSINNDNDK